jgi:hypothetical protein
VLEGATAQSFSAKNLFFEIVLNRPFLGEKKEQWRFAKKRRLVLYVTFWQGLS